MEMIYTHKPYVPPHPDDKLYKLICPNPECNNEAYVTNKNMKVICNCDIKETEE